MSRSVRVALLWGVSALSLPIRSAADPVDVANPPQGRFIDEWATVHLGGKKAGYYHSTVARDGNMIRTAADMHMRLGRVDMPVTISTQQSTLETLAGAPVEFTSTLDMATMKTATKGTFKDGKVTLVHTQYGMEQTQTYEINPASLMTWGMLRESLVRGFKPGTTYTMKVYAPDLCQHRAIDTVTTVGEWEPVHNAGTSLRGQRITTLMESPVGNLEFVAWIDKDANTLAARLPLPGLGNLEMIRVDESVALADFVAPDL
ncbi:MAG: hypothetical protein ACE5HE_14760, partial [Phycisphaerae bacterium]